jgi:transcriptional regulator with XRE-family HTH domain
LGRQGTASGRGRGSVNRASDLGPRRPLEWVVDVAAIDRVRVLRGWTRRDLARQAQVDEGTLCDLFAGRRRPTFGTLRALCGALELPLESVISFEESRLAFSIRELGSNMNMLGVLAIAAVAILAAVVAIFADRLLDSAVGGSYALVQKARARRGHRGFRIALVGAVTLAMGLTIVGILANFSR